MIAKIRRHTLHGAHARIAAEEQRTGNRTGLLVLIIVFVALLAILLRLAEFSGRGFRHRAPSQQPAAAILNFQQGNL